MNSIVSLSPQQLRRAADIKERIQSLEKELAKLLVAPVESRVKTVSRRKTLSAQGLANIRAGVRKRTGRPQATPKRKRKLSAAGRARLSTLAKERWKKSRAEGKSTL